MKLDLGCGTSPLEGFEGTDIARIPGVKHVFDLLSFPWPFEDGSVEGLRSSHFIEHIPMLFWHPPLDVNLSGCGSPSQGWLSAQQVSSSVDLLMKFFAEAHRVLEPGGTFEVIAPYAGSDRAFQDPTHRRFIPLSFFQYLDRAQRRNLGLDHGAYALPDLDFPIEEWVAKPAPAFIKWNEVRTYPDATQAWNTMHLRNFADDVRCVLKKPEKARVFA